MNAGLVEPHTVLIAQAGNSATNTSTVVPAVAAHNTATNTTAPVAASSARGTATNITIPATSAFSSATNTSTTIPAAPAGEATHTSTAMPATSAGEAAAESAAPTSPWVFFGFSFAAFLIIAILATLGMRRLQLVPRGLQNLWEMLLESLYGLPEQVMGERGREYAPFIITYFLYIVTMNLCGLLPFFKSGTANLSITLGLAIVAFFAVQYYGFHTHGIRYLAHFIGPVPALAILILPLEILSELIRPVSLSIRLYGNIYGEEQVIGALAKQFSPLVAVLMLPLQILTCILQAFVFTLLVTVYISLATEKHEEGHAESGAAPAH